MAISEAVRVKAANAASMGKNLPRWSKSNKHRSQCRPLAIPLALPLAPPDFDADPSPVSDPSFALAPDPVVPLPLVAVAVAAAVVVVGSGSLCK